MPEIVVGSVRCSVSSYLSALRLSRHVAHPALREVLRAQVRRTVAVRISRQLPWWGQGRRWGHGNVR